MTHQTASLAGRIGRPVALVGVVLALSGAALVGLAATTGAAQGACPTGLDEVRFENVERSKGSSDVWTDRSTGFGVTMTIDAAATSMWWSNATSPVSLVIAKSASETIPYAVSPPATSGGPVVIAGADGDKVLNQVSFCATLGGSVGGGSSTTSSSTTSSSTTSSSTTSSSTTSSSTPSSSTTSSSTTTTSSTTTSTTMRSEVPVTDVTVPSDDVPVVISPTPTTVPGGPDEPDEGDETTPPSAPEPDVTPVTVPAPVGAPGGAQVPASTTPAATGDGTAVTPAALAYTGDTTSQMATIGAALVVFGGLLLLVGFRPRRRDAAL